MAKKTYVVAEGMSFTALGHIFVAGEEIPESVFADKTYFAKMLSQGKIIEAKKTEEVEETFEAEEEKVDETVENTETSAEETSEAEEEKVDETVENTETSAEEPATKRSTAKGGK